MELSKMNRQTLNKWCFKVEKLLETETDEHNIEIYKKWLEQAKEEQNYRDIRKANYLRYKYGK